MEIRLNEFEIREALAKALEEKINYTFQPDPESCWFNVKAGQINGDELDDIHDVEFCYNTDQ